MASYRHLLQHTKPRFESPAKVFAKLKSKVQREMCANERIFTSTDPVCDAREKYGAEMKSPKKMRADSSSMTDEVRENHRFGSYRNEMQPLTLSPIPSPQKTFGFSYSDVSSRPAEILSPLINTGHGCTPRKRAILESADVFEPHYSVRRKQIQTEPSPIRDVDGFNVTSRTPVNIQTMEDAFEKNGAPLKSSANVFTPISNRLRKRKWELNNVSGRTKEVSGAFSQDDHHNNTCKEDFVLVRGISAGRAEINHFPPPLSAAKKRCNVMKNIPPMSPAKMFAYMKERESKKEQQEVHNVRRGFFDRGNFHQSRKAPLSTDDNMDETEGVALTSVPETVVPVNWSRLESYNSQSDTDLSEDIVIPAVPPQPVLLEDPLILNSPRITIPKKNEVVFKRNKGLQPIKFPSESVIYLKKWYLKKAPKGLFVEGIHREECIPWNSNIIVDRVSNYVLKTVSGRVYILVGKMDLHVDTGLPKWLLREFVNGFPPNWKALYDKFLSGSKNRGTARNRERGVTAKTKSEALSINLSVKRHRKNPLKTPDSCPPASSSSTTVSRSGRVIKPPLEYWKGGRVVLDAQMNVTIHECYDTCNPEVITAVSARASRKPARVFLHCSEGLKQCELANDKETSVPLRKVKAPLHRRNKAKVSSVSKASYSPEPPAETQSSSEERSGRRTSSSQRHSPAERNLHVNTVPQKQSKTEKPSTQGSTRRRHDTTRPPLRVSGSKRSVEAPPESPVNDKSSQDESSNDSSIRRKRRGKWGNRNKGEKLQRSHLSEESAKDLRKRTRVTEYRDAAQIPTKHERSKSTKTSQPPKPLPKSPQSTNKHKADKGKTQIPPEQDEDEWTEAEFMRLKEAVAFYPKHVAGYWAKVAGIVGTRSAEECHNQHTSQETSQTPAKRVKKPNKKKVEAPKDADHPVISARVGTLKRKQQVRQFLETMPRENVDDVFSSEYMQNKRFEIPSMCQSVDHDFTLSNMEPMTPMSTGFPEAKTPQCLHITPGMMGSPNRSNDDKYVFQLQKRMKKSQFNVCKQAPSQKFATTPSVKRTLRKCGNTENDTFVFWEMFPGNNGALSESGEEEDFYFSEND